MGRHRTVLISGGARSGKSSFALGLAQRLGERRAFVATAQGLDDEMRARIAQHRAERADAFAAVIEEPLDLPGALVRLASRDVQVVVVDCLTLWLSNLLLRHEQAPQRVSAAISELADALPELPFHRLLVTNEVGMGVVPPTPLGRTFRDLAGQATRRLAGRADELYLATMGVVLRLRPAPVVTMEDDPDVPHPR